MSTFDASTINIYQSPGYMDEVRFCDKSIWIISQRDNGMDWGLYHSETKVRHSAIGLHRSMNDLCVAINEQDNFLKFTLENSLPSGIHRGEHYI